MPKEKDAGERRLMLSVKTKYVAEAGAAGYADIGEYIDSLHTSSILSSDKKDSQYQSVKAALEKALTYIESKGLTADYNSTVVV